MGRLWMASLLVLAWILAAAGGQAQETGTAARLGMGARPLALGGAFTAIPGDAAAVFWNPAGLTTVRHPGATLHYRRVSATHSQDAAHLSFGAPRHGLAWGALVSVLHRHGLVADDAFGGFAGEPGANEIHAQVQLGLRVTTGLSLGLGIGPIVSSLSDAAGRTVGWGSHAGFMWSHGRSSVGMALRGLTAGLGSDQEPQPYRYRLSAGVSHRLVDALLLSAQVDQDRGEDASVASGVEWDVLHAGLFLRGGIQQALSTSEASSVFSGGVGLCRGRFSVDYAWRGGRQTGPEHLVSLNFRLGEWSEGLRQGADAQSGAHAASGPDLREPAPSAGREDAEAQQTTNPAETAPDDGARLAIPQRPTPPQDPTSPPRRQTLPVGLPEPGPPPQHADGGRPSAASGERHGRAPIPDPTRVRYVVRAGVYADMDAAALEVARFYRAKIRPDLERRGDLYIVVIKRCDTRAEADEWMRRARDAGMPCTIDEE
jgi:hypothetical protein